MPRLLTLSSAAVLTAVTVFASGTSGVAQTYQLWDLDADKRVTATEIEERLSNVFGQFDKDGDGALNAEEYDAFDKARDAEAAEHGTSLALRAVTGLSRGFTDTNYDGMVTREELLSTGRNWFNSMDRNGDGQIDALDFPSAKEFTQGD